MGLIRIQRHPSRRQLAGFAVVWLAMFAVLGGVALLRHAWPWAVALWAVAALVPAIGCFVPGWLRGVYLGAAYLTYPIGAIVSLVILAAVYYLVLAPIGLLLRLSGYDPMGRRRDPNAASYWTPRTPADDVRRYFRQF